MKKQLTAVLLALLLLLVPLGSTGCAMNYQVQAADLTEGITAGTVSERPADGTFVTVSADFAVRLFRQTVSASAEENTLLSPLSVMLALAMTANGAAGETKAQMETLLSGGIPLELLNEYLHTYLAALPSTENAKLSVANAIWFRGDAGRLTVEQDFLQTNADYYGAAAYRSAFDEQTLRDINGWVKQNTDGMIDTILDEISDDAVLYLINALAFDAEWKTVYRESDLFDGSFTSASGQRQKVEMMHSEESRYLDDGRATGFIKPYGDGAYSFVALLPGEGISIGEYVASLTGEGFVRMVREAENTAVSAVMPKFRTECSLELNDALESLGMTDAFSQIAADFTPMARSSRGNIFVSRVLHKTFIAVDERGTRAGAVTAVEMKDEAFMETKQVILDRPFVYAIVDNTTGLPVFLGALLEADA